MQPRPRPEGLEDTTEKRRQQVDMEIDARRARLGSGVFILLLGIGLLVWSTTACCVNGSDGIRWCGYGLVLAGLVRIGRAHG